MRNASDFLNKRNELNKENENHKKLVEGQWRLLTSIIEKSFENLTINTSYIDVSNCGTIYDENIRRLVTDLKFLIANDKNSTKLFFDKSEYDKYTKKNTKSKMSECKKQDDRIDKADIKEMIETIEKAYSQKRLSYEQALECYRKIEDAIRQRGIKPSEICLESNDSNGNIKDDYNCDKSEYTDISKYFEDPRGTIPILNDDSMIKKIYNK